MRDFPLPTTNLPTEKNRAMVAPLSQWDDPGIAEQLTPIRDAGALLIPFLVYVLVLVTWG